MTSTPLAGHSKQTEPKPPVRSDRCLRGAHVGSALLVALCLSMLVGGFVLAAQQPPVATPDEVLVIAGPLEAYADNALQSAVSASITAVDAGDSPYTASVPAVGLPAKGSAASQPWENAWDADGLPAWRWRSIDLDVDTSGGIFNISGSFKQIPVMIAELVFWLANWVWSVLLAVLKFGFAADELIKPATPAINAGAAFIGGKLFYMAILFAAVLGWRVVRTILRPNKGGTAELVRTGAIFILAFGMLAMVTTNAVKAHQNYPGNGGEQLQVSGTLPWMANEILDIADSATAPLAGVVTGVTRRDSKTADEVINGSDVTDLSPGNGTGTNPGVTTCVNYTNAMYDTYAEAPDNERVLIVLSRLWENTFYDSWRAAAFGYPVNFRQAGGNMYNSNIPERVMCHFAEAVNDISPQDQQRIAHTAYGDAIPAAGGVLPTVFGPYDATNNGDLRKAVGAWAACRYDGSNWVGQTEFDGAYSPAAVVAIVHGRPENVYDDLCSKVMQGDDGFDDKFYVFGKRVRENFSPKEADAKEQLKAARVFGSAYSGVNFGQRMIYGLISMLVAVMFLLSFGFIALGLIGSMLMAIACITFALPVAFALAAIGKTKHAGPVFRVTITSLLSQSFFTVLLSLIVILGGLFQALIGGLSVLPGPLTALGNGAAPVAAFYLLRKLLKSMGMADMLTPSGALTFAGSAAVASSGNKSWANKVKAGKDGKSDLQKGLSKTPWLGRKVNKLDRYAPTKDRWNRAGRADRAEANAEDEAARQEKIRENMARRNTDSKYGRARNRIDNSRLPGGTADRLRTMANGGALAVLTGVLGGPLGIGLLGATAGGRKYRQWRKQRPQVGDTVDDATADPMDYDAGATHTGREAEPQRRANVGATRTYIDTTMDRVANDMAFTNPASTGDERARAGILTAMEDMMGAYAEAHAGRRGTFTDSEMDGLRTAAAAALGYRSGAEMVVTTSGVVVPVPYPPDRARSELSHEQLTSFVHWLPEHDREVQTIATTAPDGSPTTRPENGEEYAARLFALGVARGVLSPDGSSVDVLAVNGLDIKDVTVQARVDAWQAGGADDLLDNLRIDCVSDALERRLVLAAQEITRAPLSVPSMTMTPAATATTAAGGASVSAAAAAADSTELVTQLLVAVNAARDLLAATRATGGDADVRKAAEKMAASVTRLEAAQETMLDSIGSAMVDSLEKNMQAQALRDEKFADRFDQSLADGVGAIADQLDSVRDVLKAFSDGTAGLQATVNALGQVMNGVTDNIAASEEGLREAVEEQTRAVRDRTVRQGGTTWAAPSAREVSERNGATNFPRGDER